MLVTVFEDDPKAPFSIATTTRFRRGRYYFRCITPFTLDPYLIMLGVNEVPFLSLWYVLNLGLPDHWGAL